MLTSLAGVLKRTALVELHIDRTRVGDEGVRALCRELRRNSYRGNMDEKCVSLEDIWQ